MRTNWVREKLQAGGAVIGAQLGLGSPHVAELFAHAGYDWLALEMEHSALDAAQIEHMLMAVSGTENEAQRTPPVMGSGGGNSCRCGPPLMDVTASSARNPVAPR